MLSLDYGTVYQLPCSLLGYAHYLCYGLQGHPIGVGSDEGFHYLI